MFFSRCRVERTEEASFPSDGRRAAAGGFCIPHYSFIESYFHKYGGLNTPFMSAVIYKEARVAVRLRKIRCWTFLLYLNI